MKARELTVICRYSGEEKSVARIVQSSFDAFLRKELQDAAKYLGSAPACK